MKRFLPYLVYFKPVRWHFFGGVIAGLFYAVASGFGLPMVAKVVLPLIFKAEEEPEGDLGQYVEWMTSWLGQLDRDTLIFISCLWVPLIMLIRAVGGYLNTYLINYCGYRVIEGIRDQIFTRMQALPVAFYQKHRSGDLLARLTGDAEMLRQVVSKASGDLIKQPATLMVALIFLVREALKNEGTFIVLISLLSIPLCVLPIRLIGKKLARRARILQNVAGNLSGQVAESLQAPMEIRSYNLQEPTLKKFRSQVGELIRYSMKVLKYKQFISPAVEFVAAIGFSMALYFGAQKGMTLESFMAIGFALYLSYEPIKKLGTVHTLFQQGTAALDRLEEVLHAEGELEEVADAKVPEPFVGEVSFEEVGFCYGEECILSEINVHVRPGECVALIGPSGAGKSTFAKLIPRFYDVTDGAIKISGQDVRSWPKHELREKIAVVSQSPVLFSGTIRENILLGRPGATDAEVEEAARRANAHDFILEQEDGYDTEVAEKGTKVSGGQGQRIAIARAFLKDAPILILDEATSALDNESEAKIQEALGKLIKNRTTLIIAHRLSTTKIADRILEFDRGRIVSERAEA